MEGVETTGGDEEERPGSGDAPPEELVALASFCKVHEDWLGPIAGELDAGEKAESMVTCVGSFLEEDTVLVLTDRRVFWVTAPDAEVISVPLTDVAKAKVRRVLIGPTDITIKLRSGNEKGFALYSRRKHQAKLFAKAVNDRAGG